MRKFSLFLLLAASSIPALAQSDDRNGRETRRASAAERSDDRPQRAQRSERREARDQAPRPVQVERQQSGRQGNAAAVAGMRERYQQAQQQQGPVSRSERLQRYQQRQSQQVQTQTSRNERLERYRQRQLEANPQGVGGTLAPRQGRLRTIPSTNPVVVQGSPVRHDVQGGRRLSRDDRHRWSSHWRNDRRYDWRRHRDRNRSIFRIGFYYDPFGYSYRRFGLGSYLYPSYYQSNYWINDPWQYRLPPAYGAYRWVRYHNDALLIDTYSGEVVDVIYGFFW